MARQPVEITGDDLEIHPRDEGPRGWFLPRMEETYFRLARRGAAAPAAPMSMPASGEAFASSLQPQAGEETLSDVSPTVWSDRLAEYRRRKAAALPAAARGPRLAMPAAPAIPGARNWRPLGPSVVLGGQTVGSQPVAGRIVDVAIAPGGDVVYVASAAGGVFRSDDGGTGWRSLMDGFDVDPTDFASASLACGAIAIDPADPDRVYVGTGEGDTHQMFSRRVVSALPAYRGIGPIRSDDGGVNWVTETTDDASPTLAGQAFFELAVDPRDRENVLAATNLGLYQRVARAAGGGHEWTRRRPGIHTAIAVAESGGTRRFFTAGRGAGVFHSTDGETWTRAGTGFPTANVGRIDLGVQSDDAGRLYALVTTTAGGVHGLYRLDALDGAWRKVANVPDFLPGSQGDYDQTIAVDPLDRDTVYLGGDRLDTQPFPASIWRCELEEAGGELRVKSSKSIGSHAHADVHALVHTPGEPDELWCGCDGGLFLNRDPRGDGQFASRNDGLSCLHANFIAQHPTDPGILLTGLQDNGTAHTASGSIWTHVFGGDGGYCLINWANPDQVLAFANGRVLRSTSGGSSKNSWTKAWSFPWVTMTMPFVGTPFDPDPAAAANGSLVAIGAGGQISISNDFADSWAEAFDLPAGSGNVFSLAFATPKRLYAGTTTGRVYRFDRGTSGWAHERLDNAAAGPLDVVGLVTDVAVDRADANGDSIYVAFGGMGDRHRVWHYDGSAWESRSGAGDQSLLDVEHNALVVDPVSPQNLYAGADIGVWHSPDGGGTWAPLQNGLPDAPVFDLQIHPTQRLLRAATHGRGVYEIRID